MRKSVVDSGRSRSDTGLAPPHWRDPKRHLWLLGLVVPGLVALAWLLVKITGVTIFWWSGPILIFAIIPLLDRLVGSDEANPPDSDMVWLEHDRFYRWATYLYLPNQYLSVLFACWLWSGGGWVTMAWIDKTGLMLTLGAVGGIGISAAHELGHKRETAEKWLSKIALAQTCYGHFFVEHNRGHHPRAATAEDPATSRFGESLYMYIPRSVIGGFRSAWSIETGRYARMGRSRWSLGNDILNAWLMSAVLFAILIPWFGPVVIPWLIGQAIFGIFLVESVNYLEHYGLRRQKLPDGRYERVRASHSWNSNTVVANVFLFHIQRHSDHHAHPVRRYQTLRHTEEAPQLPYGYGTMLLFAFFPPIWRRIMDPMVLRHYNGDMRLVGVRPTKSMRPRPSQDQT
ncbi:alkane 1-monooxygenase [Mycobacteroides salmoniphilum]|uniref:Alkane 1-monooxygenase 1 n=1 Tax=Mycobacteroides salmoniphilum TaxID=404941 RepID=A0A4R8SAJ6_9MYCO|nr:alkane 1-monooxygenase [Mycobacteroides salmoniphilum]TDZ91480.1 Alkane 1-monooxygenase 1 [Mycobacteroides salmoniphilum]TEA00910.1 Alkane 1-monooxygenase 1 [Mycobacteroides salmoniphilum]